MLPDDVQTLIDSGYWTPEFETKGLSQYGGGFPPQASSPSPLTLEEAVTLCVNNWGGSWQEFWGRLMKRGYQLVKVEP